MPGNYSHTTRANGLTLTDTIYNADHINHITNATPDGLDDYSVNLAQMQSTSDPGEVGTEVLATSLSGELERIRFAIKEIKGSAQWYESPTNGTMLQHLRNDVNGTFTGNRLKFDPATALNMGIELGYTGGSATTPFIDFHSGAVAVDFDSRIIATGGTGVDQGGTINILAGTVLANSTDVLLSASETAEGRAEIATQAETDAGTDDTRIVTPLKLANAPIGGKIAQVVTAQFSSVATTTTVMPIDDTIPQNTEGGEFMTLAITPTNASSNLIIIATAMIDTSGSGTAGAIALFRDATVDALSATITTPGAGTPGSATLIHSVSASSTSPTTFKIRAGQNAAGTFTFNGDASVGRFSTTPKSSITIIEVRP